MDEDLKTSGSKLIRLKNTKDARKILTSLGPVMVVVYAKWCGHCQSMFESWRELSNTVDGKAKVYVIEASDYTDEDIDGYPNMRIVNRGTSKKYEGVRDVNSMSKALLGTALGGKRARRGRTGRLRNRVRKVSHRTLRRNMTFV